jgi:short-subunit dehydrogenase
VSRPLCLVTGASAGLGAALARVYAGNGWDLALTARRADRLAAVAAELRDRHGVEALTIAADLADPDAPATVLGAIAAAGRRVDGLVNNAGYSNTQGFARTDWTRHQTFLRVMLHAPTELAHRVLPGMLERRFGRVLNVASVAGFTPGTAGDTLYGPVKSYLIKFSQGLNLECRARGVHVTALCPGYTYTEFHDVNGSREKVSKAYPRWMWLTAERVAEDGYRACEANRPVVVPGKRYKTVSGLLQALPDDWTLKGAARHGERLGRL